MKICAYSLRAIPTLVWGALMAILIGFSSSPSVQAGPFTSPLTSSPSALVPRVYLPLISVPEKPTGRVGSITPLSASVPRYSKFEITFTISTTATNFY
ncbi:MAG TPA: hypothetical protein VMP08_09070, partial [Anaerolineae bacterium]|nr:hypothetical protein [Anaerolineae bacterium]